MKTSVALQEPFSYSLLPIVVLSMLVLAYGIYLFCSHVLQKKKREAEQKPEHRPISKKELALIKQTYLTELENIRQAAYREQITTRETYQHMSRCIRQFVYEVTGIKVPNYTLFDIRKVHMPHLESLIAEFYQPEFASISQGDSDTAYEKAKRVIELWN